MAILSNFIVNLANTINRAACTGVGGGVGCGNNRVEMVSGMFEQFRRFRARRKFTDLNVYCGGGTNSETNKEI